ncbi:MAG TPA: TIGR03617 family F420-dependent LLM class oxidoreductase [Dehalococcoidia bacterium]
MKVEAGIPTNDLRQAAEWAQRYERLGYDGITTPEVKNDPFLPLAAAATTTERIELSTTAAIAFPRSPAVTAMMAWDLQRSSGGRFMLGLATQVKGHNERRFSTPWVGPAQPRMREYIRAVRALWNTWQTGAPLNFQGKYYTFTLMTPEFNPGPVPSGPPKITITAVGPAMARLAGEVADGVRMHGFCTAKYIQEVIWPELRKGAERAGRDPRTLEVSGGGFIVTGATQAEVERNLEGARSRVAFYGSTRTYHGVFEAHGWTDIGPRLHELSIQGKWDEMPKQVPDDVLEAFVVMGTYDEIVPKIKARFGGICTRIGFSIPLRTPEDEERLKAMIRELQAEPEPAGAR